jgi:hypothetical protein
MVLFNQGACDYKEIMKIKISYEQGYSQTAFSLIQ